MKSLAPSIALMCFAVGLFSIAAQAGAPGVPTEFLLFSQRNNGDLQQDGDEGLQAAPSRRECGKMKNKAEIPEPNRPPTAEALRKMITSGKSVPSKTSAQ
jgi:hypothetical protein